MNTCNVCGTVNVPGSKFCEQCGSKLTTTTDPNPKFSRAPQTYSGPKKLYRSRQDRIVAGVCGGLGDYLDVDPNIIRLLWILLGLTGTGIIFYLIAIVIIPESPLDPWAEPR